MPDDRAAADHDRWEDLMIAALDGRLDDEQSADLQRHLSACTRCHAAYGEVRDLFAGLREAAAPARPREFWDSLAAGIERGVARGVDPSEEEPASEGWRTVGAGLVAAGVAVLVLVGLYLQLPRPAGETQAFTEPVRERSVGQGESGPVAEGGELAEIPASDELLPPLRERDPLADLAEVEGVLEGLTPDEAEELLQIVEVER